MLPSAIAMSPSSTGVRPDVLLTLYVERGLWDRFLSRAALGGAMNEIETDVPPPALGSQLRCPAHGHDPRNNGEGDRTMANEKTPPDVSRRQFVGTVAATAAGLTIVPRHVLGAGFQAPSDKVNVAVVGYAHGMGTSNLKQRGEDRQHRGALRLSTRARRPRPAASAARRRSDEFPKATANTRTSA